MSTAQNAQTDRNGGFGKVVAAGRTLWLAGLGAMAEVEEEGRGLFDRLVERGRPVEERRRKARESVADRATQTARDFGKLVQDTVEYESRGMLKRLNVMTRDDVKVLSARLATLSKKIDEYVVRRQAAATPTLETETTEIVSPRAPKPPKAAARPRQRKTTAR